MMHLQCTNRPLRSRLLKFLHSLDMVEILLRIERENCKNPPRIYERNMAEGLRGGAAILMVASFEHFLRTSFDEHLSRINQDQIKLNELPDKLATRNVFANLKLSIGGTIHDPVSWERGNIPPVLETCRLLGAEHFIPDTFTETGGNPTSKKVTKMFGNVGLDNIFATIRPLFAARWGLRTILRSIEYMLDEIVRRRHVVAHSGQSLHITRRDLKRSVRFLEMLARLLDAQISNFVKGIV